MFEEWRGGDEAGRYEMARAIVRKAHWEAIWSTLVEASLRPDCSTVDSDMLPSSSVTHAPSPHKSILQLPCITNLQLLCYLDLETPVFITYIWSVELMRESQSMACSWPTCSGHKVAGDGVFLRCR